MEKHTGNTQYLRLGAMAGLSFIAMYLLMYAMVDSASNVHHNLNQVYMAGLMTAPMVVFEIMLMGMMYQDKKLNMMFVAGSLVVMVGCFLFIRQQTAISDEQFLRSMIPHHAAAILMCEEAPIEDPEIRELCRGIIESQQREIDQMTAKLSGS
jgi:uncharacterized protein (DUF305 family)